MRGRGALVSSATISVITYCYARRVRERAPDIGQYEGLVLSTARKYHERLGVEFDDLAQDLRLKIVNVVRTYDPTRSKLTERGHVFQCVMNLTKDLKRNAAQRKRVGLTEVHIEDYRTAHGPGAEPQWLDPFEFRYLCVDADEVYAHAEEDFVMPSTVTAEEAKVSSLLVFGFSRAEAAGALGVGRHVVDHRVRSLQKKLKPAAIAA